MWNAIDKFLEREGAIGLCAVLILSIIPLAICGGTIISVTQILTQEECP